MEKQKSILIIEDDSDLVEAMKIALSAKDYQVSAAYHPDEGFQKAKANKPDLIILDVMFGNHSHTKGFEYAVKFKQDKLLAPVPIMMITAINVEHPGFGVSDEVNTEFLPVDTFIDKPVDPDDLVREADKLLNDGVSKWVNWPDLTG